MIPPPLVPSFADLYAQHWRYVLRVLPDYGIPASNPAQDDVAQAVWLTVHLRLASYEAELHKTPRAWITGIARRCAANHRRAERRRSEVPAEDVGARLPAPGLNPEQAALLQTIHQAIPNEERREALVLQLRHGLSIAEIAAAQEVSEDAVEWRLHVAKEELKADDEKKSRAFLGYGSLEALAEALRPEPIPDERGAELWQRITEQIRQQQGEGMDGTSSFPPAALAPAIVPMAPAAVLTFTTAKLAGVIAAAFLGGLVIGGVLGWQTCDATRHGRELPITEATAVEAGTVQPSSPQTEAAPVRQPSVTSARTSSPRPTGAPRPIKERATETEAGWLLGQLRRAAGARNFALVLTLAEQHKGQFPGEHADEREALWIHALIQLGRSAEAEQRARTATATEPKHRRAMERAVGHALP